MNLFRRIFSRAVAPLTPSRPMWFVGRTDAGVYVDADRALKTATVWACVQYLSRTVAKLPWRVMKETEKGREVRPTHPADWMLNRRPNPEMGAFTFRQTMMAWVLLRGNAFAEIERDNRGAPVYLWPIHPDRVKVVRDETGRLAYEVQNMGGPVLMPAESIYHVRGLGDGPVGYSVIEYAAQSIGWAQATETFGANFFGEGMAPSGIITVEQGLSIEAQAELREQMENLYKGPKAKTRTMILDTGAKFERLPVDPDEAQFIETRQHQIAEICRWFGVPPHKVMDLLRATFSNIEHQAIEVVVDSVAPWVKIFEEEADYKLFGPMNREGFYTNMPLQALMRGDNASRIAFYKGMLEIGAMSINEVRALEDMNSIGTDGDARLISTNLQTLKTALNPPAPKPAAGTDSPEPAPTEPPPAKRPAKSGNGAAAH